MEADRKKLIDKIVKLLALAAPAAKTSGGISASLSTTSSSAASLLAGP